MAEMGDRPVVKVQNIVATVKLSCNVNLKTLMESAKNVEYKPRRFSAAIMRIREPRTTALIFHTGKLVVAGAKTEGDSKLASRKYARIIGKIMHCEAKILEHKVTNIVGNCDLGFPMDLLSFVYSSHSRFINYEPELFPGLLYRMKQLKLVLLVFSSGKMVIAGAKKVEDLQTAVDNLYPVLTEHRKKVFYGHSDQISHDQDDYDIEEQEAMKTYMPSALDFNSVPPQVQEAPDMEMDWEDLDLALNNLP